jgi:hypothetical protein
MGTCLFWHHPCFLLESKPCIAPGTMVEGAAAVEFPGTRVADGAVGLPIAVETLIPSSRGDRHEAYYRQCVVGRGSFDIRCSHYPVQYGRYGLRRC